MGDDGLRRFNTPKRKRVSRIPGDFCDRHHNEARANGGTKDPKNLVLLWRRLHHDSYTEYFGHRTFYRSAGALKNAQNYRSWLASPGTLSAYRLGTVIGRMRVSTLVRRIVEYEFDVVGRPALQRLFGPRNFFVDGTPDFRRMARVLQRLHRKHESWVFWTRFSEECENALRIRRARAAVAARASCPAA